MRRTFMPVAALAAWALAACSPTFNWRDVTVEPAQLKALLPCKPERASREVPMAGRQATLEVLGCEAGGATFALLNADIGDASRAGEVLWQWRLASLANLRGAAAKDTPFAPPGALRVAQSAQVVATGQRADGSKVESQAAYFAHGTRVFQAVIFADRVKPEMAEPFFAGLQFQ